MQPIFERKIQLSEFYAYLDGSQSKLIQISSYTAYETFNKIIIMVYK
jgi:hypothetical protein